MGKDVDVPKLSLIPKLTAKLIPHSRGVGAGLSHLGTALGQGPDPGAEPLLATKEERLQGEE